MANSDDKRLEKYLAGESDISKQYHQSQENKIPDSIDDAILSAARFSVRAKAKNNKMKQIIDKWQMPLSVAAIVMISVSLVITLYDEYGQSYLDSPTQPVPQVRQDQDLFETVTEEEAIDTDSDSISDFSKTIPSDLGRAAEMEAEPPAVASPPASAPAMIEETPSESLNIQEQSSQSPAKAKSIDNEQLKKQRLKQLKQDVEELKRTQSTLIEERKAIEQELDSIESRKSSLQQNIDVSPEKDVDTLSIESELAVINDLWMQGQHEQARQLLNELLTANPGISIQQLEQHLPAALVGTAKR